MWFNLLLSTKFFTDTRDSLKELTTATLDILDTSCGHRYSTSEIFKKVTFTMTNSTTHNIGVIKLCHIKKHACGALHA